MNSGPEPKSTNLTIVPKRRYGEWISAVISAIAAVWILSSFVTAKIDYKLTFSYLFNNQILNGVVVTVWLTVGSMLIGIVLGVLVAVLRQSDNRVLSGLAGFYTWFFRGTPVLVQLLIWFNLALIFPVISFPGLFSIQMTTVMTPFLAALLALGINEGSYMSEIVRSGLIAVDDGQTEAAKALGMTTWVIMRKIVLPQSFRVILPPAGNEFIALLKTSALAYVISVTELLNSAFRIYSINFRVIELLLTAAIWYLFLTTILTLIQSRVERRVNRGYGTQSKPLRRLLVKNVFGVRR